MNNEREKNPLFVPALIATLILPVGFFPIFYSLGYAVFLFPIAAIILSCVGLVIAKKWRARYRGCLVCILVSILELSFVFWLGSYLSRPICSDPAVPIQPHTQSLSPEEKKSTLQESVKR